MRALILFLTFAVAVLAQKDPLAGFDEFANQALKDWKVPGFAIAILKGDQVILSKGYGMRDVRAKLPVTPQTLFAIGSATKSFTVTSLAVLADKGQIDWDKPVREYLPDFKMYDAVATEHMTPRDLVTHRSGLPRHDMLWYNSSFTRQEIFDRLRFLPPSKDFRSTFQYQNLMFMTAGYLAGKVAGSSWENLVRREIFEPLGMSHSNFSVEESQTTADFAKPYRVTKEEITEIPFRNIDTVGPAGSINSSVEDMVKYLRMHTYQGKNGEKQLISIAQAMDMQTPQMVMAGPTPWVEIGHSSYGMGFFIMPYRGNKLVHHGGNIDGFSALVTYMPQQHIGMVILTNMNGSPMPAIVSYNVYDRLMGLDEINWTARIKANEKLSKDSADQAKKRDLSPRKMNTKPSHEIPEYAGEYEHPGYGVVKIVNKDGVLEFTFNKMTAPLRHYHYDVFDFAEAEGVAFAGNWKVRFNSNLQGDIDGFLAPVESSLPDALFIKRPDRAMTQASFLEPLSGTYMLGPQSVQVKMKGTNALTMTLPGQPVYDLIPAAGTRFTIKGLNGYSVEFKTGEIIFHQPNGTFVGKRQ